MSRIFDGRYRVDNVDRPHATCDHAATSVARAACRRARQRENGGAPAPKPIRKRPAKRNRSRRSGVGGPIKKPPLSDLAWSVYGRMRENREQQPFTWFWIRSEFPNADAGDVTEAVSALLSHGKIREESW